jgi:hypothetical protein
MPKFWAHLECLHRQNIQTCELDFYGAFQVRMIIAIFGDPFNIFLVRGILSFSPSLLEI